jgi:hypothetical protein
LLQSLYSFFLFFFLTSYPLISFRFSFWFLPFFFISISFIPFVPSLPWYYSLTSYLSSYQKLLCLIRPF